MDYSQVVDEMLSAYANEDFRGALEAVERARPELPERDATFTFWEACLHSLGGNGDAAVETLISGLDRGLAWHSQTLADHDLNGIRERAEWTEIERRSEERVATWRTARPSTFHRTPIDPVGTVIALHGAGETPQDFQAAWTEAVPADWALVAPVGDIPLSESSWAWPYDMSTNSLIESLSREPITTPVVLAGYSQGSGIAARAAWDGAVEVVGLILVATVAPPTLWTDSRRRPIPTYAVAGTEDGSHESCLAIAGLLKASGVPMVVDVREGMGHRPPEDFPRTMVTALEWIRANIPST